MTSARLVVAECVIYRSLEHLHDDLHLSQLWFGFRNAGNKWVDPKGKKNPCVSVYAPAFFRLLSLFAHV